MSGDRAPLGTFEEQVLLAVLRVGGDAIGMEVRREIERVTRREVAIGAVYSTLDRLEEKGYVRSHRAPGEGGSRRLFTLEQAGGQALASTRALRTRLWQGVDLDGFLEET